MAKKIDPKFWLHQFDKDGDAVCERDFRYADEEYKTGDVFPWRKYDLHETELRGLWLADHVAFFDAVAAGVAEKPASEPAASAAPMNLAAAHRPQGRVQKRA